MIYKGYTIEEETEDTPLCLGLYFRYFKGTSYDGQKISGAKTLNEAAAEIDELTANDVTVEDKLKVALQCIEANKEEFIYALYKDGPGSMPQVLQAQITLCDNAIKFINE